MRGEVRHVRAELHLCRLDVTFQLIPEIDTEKPSVIILQPLHLGQRQLMRQGDAGEDEFTQRGGVLVKKGRQHWMILKGEATSGHFGKGEVPKVAVQPLLTFTQKARHENKITWHECHEFRSNALDIRRGGSIALSCLGRHWCFSRIVHARIEAPLIIATEEMQ